MYLAERIHALLTSDFVTAYSKHYKWQDLRYRWSVEWHFSSKRTSCLVWLLRMGYLRRREFLRVSLPTLIDWEQRDEFYVHSFVDRGCKIQGHGSKMFRRQGDYWEDLAADRRLVCQTMICFLRQVDTMKSLYSLRGTTSNVFELGFVFM